MMGFGGRIVCGSRVVVRVVVFGFGIADGSGINSGCGCWITCGQHIGGCGILVEMAEGT
jgi:hypothetical protein